MRYEVNVTKYLMGTQVDATVIHSDIAEARRFLLGAFSEMERIEELLSAQLETSEITLLNREAEYGPVRVSAETFRILDRAKSYAEQYEGLFDLTIGALTELWGFSGPGRPSVPTSEAITAALASTGHQYLILNPADTTVFFSRAGLRIDLGGIAKGYAIDRAVAELRRRGISNFLINAGGDLFVSGEKLAGQPWTVGIKHPRRTDQLLATMRAEDVAIATSGDYERSFEQDGRRYHHILDPRTGYPATESQSITVVADSAEEADVIATYLFVRGGSVSAVSPLLPRGYAVLRVAADGMSHVNQARWLPFDLQIVE